MEDIPHECTQKATLATICATLEQLREDIKEMKTDQKLYLSQAQKADVERAKYPSPEKVSALVDKITIHDTLFLILGSAMVIIGGWVSGFIQFIFSR